MSTSTPAQLAHVRALADSGAARGIRVAARLSLTEMATQVGVSVSTIYRWEQGQRRPRGRPAIRYGALLDELMEQR